MVNDDAPDAGGPHPRPAAAWSPRTTSRRRRSTCCGPSPRAASPTWPRSTPGTSSSSPPRPRAGATSASPARSTGPCASWAPAASTSAPRTALHQVDFWTSHEALILGYEEALTRRDSLTGDWYDCSAHMLWVGERTRQLDGAHVEFLVGRPQPVGCKVGPSATPDEVVALCERLNPSADPGPADASSPGWAPTTVEDPPARRCSGRRATSGHRWCGRATPCTATPSSPTGGRKTRRFDDMLDRDQGLLRAPTRSEGTWPGGVHVELTGDDVTECLGGVEDIVGGPAAPALHDDVRPPAERPPVARPGLPGRRAAAGLTDRRRSVHGH